MISFMFSGYCVLEIGNFGGIFSGNFVSFTEVI